jgi:DNA polymerase III subunit gamma/tau
MYQVIARKYRPQNFGELIGQEHVQKTLSNAIESRRIAHGYIFSGQRGTGKTTVARILARCLNCIHGPTAIPCGICSSCTEISAGNSVDVIEIDAASNRGINEMREIRENVRYRPARDRYKVFIIDEAHQITKEAFNALLKTLEEPPEWVVFILCTTEANEIPNTIASRCQHFTFRSVPFDELVARMKFIVAEEGIETTEEVLSVIAQAGEGSVRDSLSALDQAIACCGTTLDIETIRSLLGVFGTDQLRAVADAIQQSNGSEMMEIVQNLESTGQSLQHFCRELARYWRNLLVARISGQWTRLIAASEHEQAALRETAQQFSEDDLTRFLNLTLATYQDLQTSLQPRLHLELGLVKLVHAGRLKTIEQALADLGPSEPVATSAAAAPSSRTSASSTSALSATARAGLPRPSTLQVQGSTAAATPLRPISPPAVKEPARTETSARTEPPPQPQATEPAAQQPASQPVTAQPAKAKPEDGDLKSRLQEALSTAGLTFSADALRLAEVSLKGSELTFRAPQTMLLALRDKDVARVAVQVLGRPIKVVTEAVSKVSNSGENGSPAREAARAMDGAGEDSELRERALSHPGVKRFQELFPNAQVRAVRNLNE